MAADPGTRADELCAAALAGDRRALARLLTAIENRTPVAEAALRRLYPSAGRAHLVGITGPPGAGKSTLVAALIGRVREVGRAVAVIAVDPSSPITGGALLGDRVRMQAYADDPDVFIRSMASRGNAGGLASTTGAAAAVLDAVGFDLVLVETVGTGQSEVEVAAMADTTVVLQAPEMGDEVQAIKAGLLEVADLVVVNKGDRPGAGRTAAQLRAMLSGVGAILEAEDAEAAPGADAPAPGADAPAPEAAPGADAGGADARGADAGVGSAGAVHDLVAGAEAFVPTDGRARPKRPEVLVTTAATGEGVAELLAALDRHRAAGRGGIAAAARFARAERQVRAIVAERLHARLHGTAHRSATEAALREVAAHRLDPYEAADRLLASLEDLPGRPEGD